MLGADEGMWSRSSRVRGGKMMWRGFLMLFQAEKSVINTVNNVQLIS